MSDGPKWVQLSTLAPGTAFLTEDGRLGAVEGGISPTGRVPVTLLPPPYSTLKGADYLDDVLVFPLDPSALADDLAELAALRGWVQDERGLSGALLAQELARERERCAAELELRGKAHSAPSSRERLFALAAALRALGDPPAPEEVYARAAEAARLRAALEGMVKTYELEAGETDALAAAREALGEG